MSKWDGQTDRRSQPRHSCCDEFQRRVSHLEAYKETQERDIERLIRNGEQTNARLDVTNQSLNRAINKMTEIKTTQRNTHIFAGSLGAILATVAEIFSRKIFGG